MGCNVFSADKNENKQILKNCRKTFEKMCTGTTLHLDYAGITLQCQSYK